MWQTSIRHEWASDHSVIVQMVYAYSADGLITDVAETGPQGWSAAVQYVYDNRNRLIEEERTGTHPYHRLYTYDPGGNRLTKTDGLASERTVYHYDLEDPQQYGSLNNRLLFSELFDESGLEPVLTEKVYYEYDIEGRATLIVRETIEAGQPTMYHATDLQYNKQGELWFVTRRHWEAGDAYCEQQVIDQILEVRGSGRARHVARERDPAAFDWIVPDTAVWSDYDGDTIYGDYTAEWVEVQPDVWELEVEDRTAYLPGIGQMDNATGEVMYTHGDQVGSLRAVTRCTVGAQECIPGETATVLQRPVYTAFGELVYDLAMLDTFIRYRYAGDWGYEGRLGSETNGGSDSALGLPYTHVGYRWYDPSTGRFLQRDPIGIRGGWHTYEYLGNTPVKAMDPYGLDRYYIDTGFLGHHYVLVDSHLSCSTCAAYYRIDFYGTNGTGWLFDNGSVQVAGWKFRPGDDLSYPDAQVTRIKSTKEQDQACVNQARKDAANPHGYNICLYNCQSYARDISRAGLPPPPSSPWGPPCLVAGTPVLTPWGVLPIEELRPADAVTTWDFEQGAAIESVVRAAGISGHVSTLVDICAHGACIRSTRDHPYWVHGRGWVHAENIMPGDLLLNAWGECVQVDGVECITLDEPVPVYDISIGEYRWFFVGDCAVLVHNT